MKPSLGHLRQSEIKVGLPVRVCSTLSKHNTQIGVVVEAEYKKNKVEFMGVLSTPEYETFMHYQLVDINSKI